MGEREREGELHAIPGAGRGGVPRWSVLIFKIIFKATNDVKALCKGLLTIPVNYSC